MQIKYQVLPDLEALGLEKPWEAIAELLKEYEKLREEWFEGKRRAIALKDELERARQRDLDERARAIRRGTKDPGHVHEEKVSSELDKVNDAMALREAALAAVEREIESAAAKGRPEWRAQIAERVKAAEAEMFERLEAFREAMMRYQEMRGVAYWLEELPAHYGAHHGDFETAYSNLQAALAKETAPPAETVIEFGEGKHGAA